MITKNTRNAAEAVGIKADIYATADYWHGIELRIGHPDALKRGCNGGWEDLSLRVGETIQSPSPDSQRSLTDLAHSLRRGLSHRGYMRQVNKG